MAVSKRLRYEILRRDSHTCRYCGATAPDVPLRVDHVTPVALGGTDTPDNLVTSCEPCNSGKSSATVDSAVVAAVTDDALRWAEAMRQAAADLAEQQKPKLAYRAAFESAWNGWTYENNGKKRTFNLDPEWKSSLDRFREAGLPVEVLPDIVDKAMANKTVLPDNLFRYCCGIAWRMISDLQDRAKVIVGGSPRPTAPVDSIIQAAMDVWAADAGDDANEETRQSLFASAQVHREADVDPHRLVEAAQYAAWFGLTGIGDAITALEHDSVLAKWQSAWHTSTGEYASDEQIARVKERVEALLAAGVYYGRLEKAAVYAGAQRSTFLHFGLTDEESAVAGGSAIGAKAMEIWSRSYFSAAGRWPSADERAAFTESIRRIGRDGDTWIADIYPAAAAAGAYQDPDIGTCITRHLSVFEAAARPLAPAA
ncbi:HNH endonuclease [Streptomyces sp. NBC_01716]|uniref:HNH endonuclease n=1 Tax=Streptomyces sp. NBC_01716 TaxID=2975917 RepID=UPI002E368E01|nr:HNH endonuclease [Streptomyces sp. NBC_01716]